MLGLYALLVIAALAFPFFLVNAIVYSMKEDEDKAIKNKILSSVSFACVIFLLTDFSIFFY